MQDFSEDRNPVEALAEQYLERHRNGENPELSEYTEKYPEHAEEIEDLFPALLMMEDIRPDSEDATGTFGGSVDDGMKLEQLGDYRILREVGRGGMGVVYEALHESLGRRVALKVLPQHATLDHKQLRRFDREVKSAARLHHTNIVPIFGVGHEEGIHYYVMQFIQGLGLDEILVELKQMQSANPGLETPSLSIKKTSDADDENLTATKIRQGESRSDRTMRNDVSAVDIAQSLMAGRFEQTLVESPDSSPGWDTPALDKTMNQVESIEVDRTEISSQAPLKTETTTGRLSDTFSLSSSSLSSPSLSMPGLSETPETRKSKKQTYWDTVAHMGRQVAAALDYAHEQGILHRDIKPGNLLLDMGGTVWVTDFGLAKAEDQQDITHTGDIIGTLRYMPPESFEGHTDSRSDIYALGLTLYEMLSLEPAFNERDRHSLIKQVTTEAPARLDKLNPEIPRDLVTIIHKAIDRDPNHRYQTSGELAEDLQRFLVDEPIKARRLSLSERYVRWARRNKLVASLGAVITALLVFGVTTATISAGYFRDLADTNEQLAIDARIKEQVAIDATKVANDERREVQKQRDLIQKQQTKAVDNLYASRITTAGRALETAGGQRRLQDLLALTRPKPGETDRRGWEWYYLNTPHENGVETLVTEMRDVHAAQFSPDGKQLAYAGDSGTITIRDMRAGKDLLTIATTQERILRLAWSPDGKELASGGLDTAIKIWDPKTGLERISLTGIGSGVFSLAWSPDGTRLAAGDFRSNAHIWDARTGEELHTLTKHTNSAHANSWSSDGKILLTSDGEGNLILWDAETGDDLETLIGHDVWVRIACFSPDGERIASADGNGNIKLWNAQTRKKLDVHFQGHSDAVNFLAWHPEGNRFATAILDGTVVIWNAKTGQAIQTLSGHTKRVWGVDWDPSGERLATSSSDGTVKLWNLNELTDVPTIPVPQGNAKVVTYSPDGIWMAAGGDDRSPHSIIIRNVQTGQSLQQLTGHTSGINSLSFSPNSNFLVSAGGGDGSLRFWDVESGRELASRIAPNRPNQHAVWSPDGKTLASGPGYRRSRTTKPKAVTIWNVEDVTNPTKRHTLRGHKGEIHALAFSPDGKRLASAGFDGFGGDATARILIWDPVQGGEPIGKLPGPLEAINSLAWHPDGTRLASAARSDETLGSTLGFVRIFDVEKSEEIFSLKNHTDGVNSVAWNSDGSRLFSGSDDRTLRIWNPLTGMELLKISSPGNVNSIAFSPDDMQIASANNDGNIRIYDARNGYLRDRSEKMLDYFADKQSAGTATAEDFLTRAEIHSRQLQWDKAKVDYGRATELMSDNKPNWFFSSWWVLGPYPGDDVTRVFSPDEHLGSINPAQPLPAADGETELPWQQAELRTDNGLEFGRYFDLPEKRICYAYCRIYSFKDRQVGLMCGADDFHRLWLNGEVVSERRSVHGRSSSRDHVKLISLKQGWNSLLMKVGNSVGNHDMYLQLSDDPTVLADAFERSRLQQPDWQASLQQWERALQRQPENPYLLNRHSKAAQNVGEIQKAMADLSLLVKNHPDNVAILLDRAKLLKLQSSWVEALSDIQVAVKLQPSNLELQMELGTLHARSGVKTQPTGPATIGETTQSLPLKHPVAFLARGVAYAEMGRNKLADADISRALKELELEENSDFDILEVLRNVADRFVEKKEIGKAVDLFAQIVSLQPENRDLLIQHANFAGRIGRWNEAAESLSKAVELDPNVPEEAFHLAPLLIQNRDEPGYRQLRRDMLELWGGTDDVRIAERTAKVCLLLPAEGEELQTAVDLADRAMEAGPNHGLYRWIQLAKGMADYRKGDDYQAAVTILNSSLSKFQRPGGEYIQATIELLLAMSHQKLNQPKKARELFQIAEQKILNDVPSLKDGDLGRTYHDLLFLWTLHREAAEVVMGPSYRSMLEATDLTDQGRNKEALDMLAKIEIPEDNIDFYKTRGGLYLRLQDLQQAADDFVQIAQLEPENSFHWMKAASLLVAAGDIDSYRQFCTAALDRFGTPNNKFQTDHIVKICSILPQDDTILQQTTRLADEGFGLNPTFGWAKMTSALSEYRRSNFKDAIQWGTQSLVISSEKLPDSKIHLNMAAISHLVQAMSYHQLKQPQQAQAALKEGLGVCNGGLPEFPAGGWWDSFITQALRREAEMLINGKQTESPKPVAAQKPKS